MLWAPDVQRRFINPRTFRGTQVWCEITQGFLLNRSGQPVCKLILTWSTTSDQSMSLMRSIDPGCLTTSYGNLVSLSPDVRVTTFSSCPAATNSSASIAATDSIPPTLGENA